MDSSSVELPGSEIGAVSFQNGCLRIHFSRAYIVKTMTGSPERTRWWQSGDLIMEGAQPRTPLPAGAMVCEGGDIDDNIFTYRDMIPIPLDTRGRTRCELRLRGASQRLVAEGAALRLEMEDVPKYIEHIRSDN
jgi:hypothetical protein